MEKFCPECGENVEAEPRPDDTWERPGDVPTCPLCGCQELQRPRWE